MYFLKAFHKAFFLADRKAQGLCSSAELQACLLSIEVYIDKQEMTAILDKVDPTREGVDLEGFIRFMFQTLVLKDEFSRIAVVKAFKDQRHKSAYPWYKKRKEPWYQFITDFIQYGGRDVRVKIEQMEAAFVIQEGWARYIQSKKLKKEMEDAKVADNQP